MQQYGNGTRSDRERVILDSAIGVQAINCVVNEGWCSEPPLSVFLFRIF